MTPQAKGPAREAFSYVRLLLAERTRELQALEKTKSIDPNYQSCHRSLAQAIEQLKVLLSRNDRERTQKEIMNSKSPRYTPPSLAVHNLIDKLAALIGQTDLLIEKTPEDSPAMRHAQAIRTIAKAVLDELAQFQSDLTKKVG